MVEPLSLQSRGSVGGWQPTCPQFLHCLPGSLSDLCLPEWLLCVHCPASCRHHLEWNSNALPGWRCYSRRWRAQPSRLPTSILCKLIYIYIYIYVECIANSSRIYIWNCFYSITVAVSLRPSGHPFVTSCCCGFFYIYIYIYIYVRNIMDKVTVPQWCCNNNLIYIYDHVYIYIYIYIYI
jgi:hypothetical protein